MLSGRCRTGINRFGGLPEAPQCKETQTGYPPARTSQQTDNFLVVSESGQDPAQPTFNPSSYRPITQLQCLPNHPWMSFWDSSRKQVCEPTATIV